MLPCLLCALLVGIPRGRQRLYHCGVVCTRSLAIYPSPQEVVTSVLRVLDAIVMASDGVQRLSVLFAAAAEALGTDGPGAAPDSPRYMRPFPVSSDSPSRKRVQLSLPAAPSSGAAPGTPLNLPPVPLSGSVCEFARTVVRTVVRRNLQDASNLLDVYEPYQFLLSEEQRLDAFLAGEPSLEECDDVLAEYGAAAEDIRRHCPTQVRLDLVVVVCSDMNTALLEHVSALSRRVLNYIDKCCAAVGRSVHVGYKAVTSRLLQRPTDSRELVHAEAYFDQGAPSPRSRECLCV